MSKFLDGFVGCTAMIPSKTCGQVMVEAVSFIAATDGDLVVHFGHPFVQHGPLLVRIHSECVFGQVLNSDLCDCAEQLAMSLEMLRQEGNGLLFYLRLDGRGAGLAAKVKATALEVAGCDTYDSRLQIGVAPEGRDFSAIGNYLQDHGVQRVRLLTNNPLKREGIASAGLEVIVEPLVVEHRSESVQLLYKTKKERFHHDIP